ncbi:MAG: flavocytochrome c [Steroidobacteraceae bacterium]
MSVTDQAEIADLVVIGAGLAGLAAALEAAEAGAHVVLLEKLEQAGGSSAMSGGCFAFAGTDLQCQHAIEDSAELLYQDLREVGKFKNSDEVVRAYVSEQLATYEWLRAHGAQFSPVIEAASGQSVPRVHSVDPADLVRGLMACCRATGRVEVRFGKPAVQLICISDHARVDGVVAGGIDGNSVIRARHGVVLASGGFCRNPELIHHYAPQYDEAVFIGGDGSTGDGLRLAGELGAATCDMQYIKGTFGKHPIDELNHHSCLAVYKGAIAVNQGGHRFVDESLSYKLLGDAVMAQPYHVAYQILDQDILESGDDRVRILDFMRRFEEGLFVTADSLEALAARIEVPAKVLMDTVARYNAAVTGGVDAEFGRRCLVHEYGRLRKIVRPPFHAYPSTAAVFGTYCGLRIDGRMRVLDGQGTPIAGLYAAGEVVGGLHGAAYMTGSALGKAAIFGRISARTALADAT